MLQYEEWDTKIGFNDKIMNNLENSNIRSNLHRQSDVALFCDISHTYAHAHTHTRTHIYAHVYTDISKCHQLGLYHDIFIIRFFVLMHSQD